MGSRPPPNLLPACPSRAYQPGGAGTGVGTSSHALLAEAEVTQVQCSEVRQRGNDELAQKARALLPAACQPPKPRIEQVSSRRQPNHGQLVWQCGTHAGTQMVQSFSEPLSQGSRGDCQMHADLPDAQLSIGKSIAPSSHASSGRMLSIRWAQSLLIR